MQVLILVKLNIVFYKPTNMIKLLIILFTKINHSKHISDIHWNPSWITILGAKVNLGTSPLDTGHKLNVETTLRRCPVWKSNERSIYILCPQDIREGLSNSCLKNTLVKVFAPGAHLESSCKLFCKK